MTTQAPEAPVTDAPPADAPPAPVQPPVQQQPAQPPPPQQQPPAPPPPPQPPSPPAQPPADPPKPKAPPEPDWKAEADKIAAERDKLKAEAERWKAQSRAQEARSKNNHKELQNRDAILREIAAKVGVEFDDKPDPEELTRKLGDAQATARSKSVELAVFQHAFENGVNANALLDSREFMAKTAALDPDAVDFTGQVADLVAQAATQPRYQAAAPPAAAQPAVTTTHQPADNYQQPPAPPQPPAQPPASSSGADFSGAPPGDGLWTQATYDYWATGPGKALDRDGKVMSEAIEKGLLAGLGIGKPRRTSRR